MNSASRENWKEPSSSTILPEASFYGESNEESLNVIKLVGNNRKYMGCKIYSNIT